ncbi:MAG: neuromedin U [Deltaproteobacteria bacterium]|nr:neuromedin U [Deltaproteobacteria bacterium]
MNKKWLILIVFAVFVCIAQPAAAQEEQATGQEDLAKKSQNPVGNMISVPIEYCHYDGMDNDGSADALIVKPVYPTRIGNMNLINRFIIPYLGIDAHDGDQDLGDISIPGSTSRESGLGNIQYQGFFTAAEPGKIIWGLGPELPTNTSGLGSDKWSAGPAALIMTMPGKWVVGALAQNMWSFAGSSSDPDVNKFAFQYFLNYNLSNGWYLTSSPIMTADWEKPSGEKWTIPVGGGFGKLVRFGKQSVDGKVGVVRKHRSWRAPYSWTIHDIIQI